MGEDQFTRLRQLLGEEGIARLRSSFVVIAGLGAVGSYALEALARAGVGRLRLVDFDRIKPSNLNRQILALHSTVGQPKAALARARVQDINPACLVEAMEVFVHTDTMDQILGGEPDYVVDAIDGLNPKIELLHACARCSIPLISCMGAALRTDPTCVRVGPLSRVHHCSLASKVRKRLRARGAGLKTRCVYSIEPQEILPPTAISDSLEEKEDGHRGRRRHALGSLPTLPGIFGLTAANEVIRALSGFTPRRPGDSGENP